MSYDELMSNSVAPQLFEIMGEAITYAGTATTGIVDGPEKVNEDDEFGDRRVGDWTAQLTVDKNLSTGPSNPSVGDEVILTVDEGTMYFKVESVRDNDGNMAVCELIHRHQTRTVKGGYREGPGVT